MTKRNWYIEGKAILEIVSWWRTGYCSVGGCLNLLQHKAQKLQVKWLQLLGVRGFSIAFKCMPVTTLFIECYGADTCCLLYQWYTLWLWNQNFMIFLKSIRVSGRLVPTVFFFHSHIVLFISNQDHNLFWIVFGNESDNEVISTIIGSMLVMLTAF